MKKLMMVLALGSIAFVAPAQAANRMVLMPIAAAMADNDAKHKLEGVQYFFGKQEHPAVAESLVSDKTSQKTNSFGKSDEKACNWAFLSAMLSLEKRAHAVGADAVINIVSNYSNNERSSETEFECHVGGIMAGVALKGDFVKLKK